MKRKQLLVRDAATKVAGKVVIASSNADNIGEWKVLETYSVPYLDAFLVERVLEYPFSWPSTQPIPDRREKIMAALLKRITMELLHCCY